MRTRTFLFLLIVLEVDWFNGKFNWTSGDTWNQFDGSTLTFNESKLETIYYNATQSQLVSGTIDGGFVSGYTTSNRIL